MCRPTRSRIHPPFVAVIVPLVAIGLQACQQRHGVTEVQPLFLGHPDSVEQAWVSVAPADAPSVHLRLGANGGGRIMVGEPHPFVSDTLQWAMGPRGERPAPEIRVSAACTDNSRVQQTIRIVGVVEPGSDLRAERMVIQLHLDGVGKATTYSIILVPEAQAGAAG